MNKELKEQARKEFDEKKWQHWHTRCSQFVEIPDSLKDQFKSFLDSIIDKTVQQTEERIAQGIKLELGLWNGFGEYYDNVTKFANNILSLITNKNDNK